MQIQSGKLYKNRTWKYLYPCLKSYGSELTSRLSEFLKLAVGVKDYNVKIEDKAIFILFDTNLKIYSQYELKKYKAKFSRFLEWLSYQEYFIKDYVFGDNQHMVVLKIPKRHYNSYSNFILGNYSKMYNLSDRKTYFKSINKNTSRNTNMLETAKILNKDPIYLPTFLSKVNERFKTNVGKEHFLEAELDFPPDKKQEIFNYI